MTHEYIDGQISVAHVNHESSVASYTIRFVAIDQDQDYCITVYDLSNDEVNTKSYHSKAEVLHTVGLLIASETMREEFMYA